MKDIINNSAPEGAAWEALEQATEFWRLNLAELAEQCTMAECDPVCLAYGRPELCERGRHG